jgi:hypothetical protein
MPSLRHLANSPYWTACFTLPDGRRTNRSTKTTDRRVAFRLANEWDRASKKERAGLLVQEQSRSVLNDILATVGCVPVSSETVDAFLKQWLAGKPEATRKRYTAPVNRFLNQLASSQAPVASIDYKTALLFIEGLKARGVAPKTVELEARTLHAAFNLAQKLGLIPGVQIHCSLEQPFSFNAESHSNGAHCELKFKRPVIRAVFRSAVLWSH